MDETGRQTATSQVWAASPVGRQQARRAQVTSQVWAGDQPGKAKIVIAISVFQHNNITAIFSFTYSQYSLKSQSHQWLQSSQRLCSH